MTKKPVWKPRDTNRARELRNAATPAERELWKYLSRSQMGVRFNRQMQVGSFFPDFLCRSTKLIVEVDGHSHDIDPDKDRRRDAYFAKHGYRVLHFSNEDVLGNAEGVMMEIQRLLDQLPTPNPSRRREGGI